jgi:sugar lactone lactonase YvrE
MKQQYLPALLCLILGGAAPGKTVPTFATADLVLGQSDFVTSSSAPVTSSFSLNEAVAIVVDPVSQKVFVSDRGNNRVLRYPNKKSLTNGAGAEAVFGQSKFSASSFGTGELSLNSPEGLFFDRLGRLWVADSSNNRVLMYEAASYRETRPYPDRVYGQPDFTTTGAATTASKMSSPYGVWVDANDRLWVSEFSNNRILRFDSISSKPSGSAADGVLGQALFTSSSSGSGSSGLSGATSIAVSQSGTLFAASTYNNCVLRFDNAATLGNGAGASTILGQPNFSTSASGTTATSMNNPYGVWITAENTLWVCDYSNNRVLRFDNATSKVSGAAADGVVGQQNFTSNTSSTTNRTTAGPFFQPFVDTSGSLWVPVYNNNRVLRFPADATKPLLAVTTIVPKTTALAQFTIKGTASDGSGISKVQYKVNSGSVKTATGTTSWQIKAALAAGDNTITIYAIDTANNQSTSKVLKIKRTSSVAPFSLVAGR